MAGLEAASGRLDDALALVREARASLSARAEPWRRDVRDFSDRERSSLATLEGVILMRAGRRDDAREALGRTRWPNGGSLAESLAKVLAAPQNRPWYVAADLAMYVEGLTNEDRSTLLFVALIQDRGDNLSEQLHTLRTVPPGLLPIAGLTVHDARGREALSAWLRRGEAPSCHGCDVGARFADVAAHLALAEAIGDEAMLAELRGTAEPFRRALLRRRTALPLLLLEQIQRKWVPPVELALGDRHTCLRSGDATVRCWGAGDRGQLGAPGGGRRLTPAVVEGLPGVTQIAAGGDQTCARTFDGSVLCWGAGSPVPAPVPGVSGAARIAVGHGRACAVGSDSVLTCWGAGHVPGPSPALRDVVDVALGVNHACALRRDATVWCWGSNAVGQLGDDTPGERDAPRPVPSVAGATHLAAGYFHTCALLGQSDSAAFTCWGEGEKGQLGTGAPTLRGLPGTGTRLWHGTALSLGNAFSCSLWCDDAVECWGANDLGQLGNGSLSDRHQPWPFHFVGVAQVAAGGAHGCLLTKSGEVWCWGANRDGQVGDGSTATHEAPEMVRL
jgi:alpha-tubulin suppressor-like RCC1 family protein